jgi:hypothetical protein
MWRFAKSASLTARCKRCKRFGVTKQTVNDWLKRAAKKGCREHLARYLDGEIALIEGNHLVTLSATPGANGPPNPTSNGHSFLDRQAGINQRYGVMAPGVFVPPPGMQLFREVAKRQKAKLLIFELQSLPCFREWMMAWADPTWKPAFKTDKSAGPEPDKTVKVAETDKGVSPVRVKRRRGRPEGMSDETAKKYAQMRKAWKEDREKFPTLQALADDFHVSRSLADAVINNRI